jgi:predicted phosphoadenosine phosphosulfate sulfurtransferase
MPKNYLGIDVYNAAIDRIKWTFDRFDKIYVAFSGGKDSSVMLHLVMDEAIKRNVKVGVCFVDLEGQYKLTINHIKECFDLYKQNIEIYWICLPIHLRNAVSVYEPFWIAWDKKNKDAWIREEPEIGIFDENYFPFFREGMEFEEFVPEFGEWYAENKSCACFVGIRADESLNRFRTLASKTKISLEGKQWTTLVKTKPDDNHVYNIYPIYDWKTADIWTYHAKNKNKPYNKLYDYMYKAGLTIHQMRICQPYGDDQRRGLWLFHLIEPETWARIVTRVNGANGGALYIQEWGNINGYRKITKPPGHTWKTFAELLLNSMPPKTKEHYQNKVILFIKWWIENGDYSDGIPDEAPFELEAKRKVPSWRRICKSLLRNDYWCKGIGYTQHKSDAYKKYLDLMRRRKAEWKQSNQMNLPFLNDEQNNQPTHKIQSGPELG